MAEVKAAKAAKPKTVKIRLPISHQEKRDEVVIVNGRTFQIQRGVAVEVPEYVAEVLERKEEMLRKAYDFDEEAAEKAKAKELT